MNEEIILAFIKKGDLETVEFKSTQKTNQKSSTKGQILDYSFRT